MTEGLRRVLSEIQGSLSPINVSMKKCIDDGLNMNLDDMNSLGNRLIFLAECFRDQLKELKHTVLIFTLMDAGLSVVHRVRELKNRALLADDTVFFTEVYLVTKLIEDTIASGEYFEELAKIYQKRLSEDLRTRT
ncbi:MAG: hypothetical protein FGF48_08040 [Candidatus Brockarchaeota archaeon]|nr:hypothetical protein [Candidatus Brockarchaeota archaeon]